MKYGIRLDGKRQAEILKKRIQRSVSIFSRKTRPTLSVILVGENLASETFVKIKKRFGESVGIEVEAHHLFPERSKVKSKGHIKKVQRLAQEVKILIQRLNRSKNVHGILLQLPLPIGFRAQEYIDLIDVRKDVDGLRKDSFVRSPVAESVGHLLRIAIKQENTSSRDTHLTVGRSNKTRKRKGLLLVKSDEFASSLLKSLSTFPVEWDVMRVTSRDMRSHVSTMRRCDIVISALGLPRVITPNMIKRGAVIIDVGFTKVKGEIMGDFHPDCYGKSSFYSPVPGGVGPLTVAFVFKNLMRIWKR